MTGDANRMTCQADRKRSDAYWLWRSVATKVTVMARSKPEHTRIRNGRLYYEPTKAMKAAGFISRALGPDCDESRAQAEHWNTQWQILRQGLAASNETIESAGFSPNRVDVIKAWGALEQMRALVDRVEHASTAVYVAKQMRRI